MGWCYGAIWLLKWAHVNWCHLVVEVGSCELERERDREREREKPLTVVAGGKSCGTWLATGDEGA